jgi:HlyD family secretion protein
MLKPNKLFDFIRRQPKWRLVAAASLAIAGTLWLTFRDNKAAVKGPTFAARRGALEITVLEGGSLQALSSQEVKCEVRVGHQGTKILKIVEEGYLVTEEDVRNGKVLVELDSSDLQQQITQQEIQYQSALASLIDAEQNYEIQLRQNQSDIQAAEQKVRFARMDFDKFLGDDVAAVVVAESGLDALLAMTSTNVIEKPSFQALPEPRLQPLPERSRPATNAPVVMVPTVFRPVSGTAPRPNPGIQAQPEPAQPADPVLPSFAVHVDFSKYANLEVLGDGEAKQKLRKLDDDLQVAKKEFGQSQTTLEGTRRLAEKGFLTRNDLQRDELSFENSRLKVQTATTARDLFMKYDFLKLAEESLSKFADSVRELDKARRVAVSKQAQSRARLSSAQGQHEVQAQRRKELREQVEKCVIVAQKPGLVVYGGGREEYFGGEERIREGATVRERQSLITIPDMTRMAVNVKIHESYIKKIQRGQKARITVDAYADKLLTGEVTKVAVLPDSQNRWMNPDMKIYNTTVAIDGTHEWVKPGMSAKVEVLVTEIPDCIYVPLQAVNNVGEKQLCYVATGLRPEPREVKLGEFNDEFIEVRSGLREGDRVYLRPPSGLDADKRPKAGEKEGPEKEKEQQPAETAATVQARKN